ncbi:hypothetical protein FisN_8Lh172 [Fistulifera solaris]|uniref:Mitochondral 37S ribosomal protein S27 n=1 Tax=Fistulifera solaris TaxID=1519565 RepID=A0A1Z5JDH6_FISSO|nr:hypothetical protein FisN_8Lh172 [Fistulifera solaris]|eukprot:GAX12070.1 hypothetical protein FisN_8Lh172 [Fistulifera solaris]
MSSLSKSISFSPAIRKGIAQVKRDVLGHVPQLQERTGYQFAKKQLTGVYLNQYYTDPIAKSARQAIPGFMTELEERQQAKLVQRRRQGKGPPKKGSGARSKKKK